MFNRTSEELYFKLQVNAKGWVGFGLANDAPTNMTDYDVAVGGVYGNGSCYIQDYLTIGQMKPRLDLQEDWKGNNCSEKNGVTTLFFSRAKNTSDDNDTAVQEGMPLCIIWAYHGTNDVANDTAAGFPRHTAQDFECNKTLVPAGVPPTTTQPTASPSSVVVSKKPGPQVKLSLKVTINCNGDLLLALNISLQADVKTAYVNEGFKIKSAITTSISCNSLLNIVLNLSFYSGNPAGKTIQGVFDDAVKDGSIRNLTTINTVATFTFDGVTTKFKPKDGQCKQVCCDGAGGEMTVALESCTPDDLCEGISEEKKEDGHCPGDSKSTCTVECPDDSGGIHNSPSFAVVILLAIASFIKTAFY